MTMIWICTCAFLALAAEILVANSGFLIPVIGLIAFYLFVVFRWERPLLPLVVMAAAFDLTLGRTTFPSVLMLFPVAGLAAVWRRQGDRREPFLQALPGVVIGVVWGGGVLILESLFQEHVTFVLLRHDLWLLVECAFLSALALPVAIVLMDALSRRIAVPRYAVARYMGGKHGA